MNAECFIDKRVLDTDRTDTDSALQVVIAYKSHAAGKRAMRVLADLGQDVGDGIEFRRYPWPFELLADAHWRYTATKDGIKADILIIATNDSDPLPPTIAMWVETILSRKQGQEAAVVALFGCTEREDAADSPSLEKVQAAARRSGLAFFAPKASGELHHTVSRLQHRAELVTPLLNEILHQAHPEPHWGINE